jgi:repressor LexA
MKTIQNSLRHYRELKGLTQQQVADYMGFKSTARISKWEKGVQYPHVNNLFKLAKLFGVKGEDLYFQLTTSSC